MMAYFIFAAILTADLLGRNYATPTECSAPPEMSEANFQQWKLQDFDHYEGTNLEVTYKNGNLKVHCGYDKWVVNNETHISAESSAKKGEAINWRMTLIRQSRTEFALANQPATKEWVAGFIPGKVLVMLKCVQPQLVQAYITSTDKASNDELQVVERYLNDKFEQLAKLKIDFVKCSATI